ncbi:MAG: alkylmercury lyase family protein [Pseudomonadota bacterium]
MSAKVEKALDRLIGVLPLKAKQESCGPEIKALHQKVLRSFVEKGRILTKEEMAQHVGNIDEAASILKTNDMVVFSCSGQPIGAYPFTMEDREHKIRVNGHTVNAMCALDALAVSPMFGVKTEISSKCRATGAPVVIRQTGKTIENPEEAAGIHFGIIWKAASSCSCCANSLCMEMMFLKDEQVAETWLAEDNGNRETFTLQEAVDFGAQFFVPLMA